MDLKDGEKLILVMLSDIYKHLGIKGEIDPEFVLNIVCSEHHWALKERYSGLFNSKQTPAEVVDETYRILQMFRLLERWFDKLPDKEKTRVEKEAQPFGMDWKFAGFDANHEDHHGVAFTIINQLGKFEEFKDRALDSHSSAIDAYRRMYKIYKPMSDPLPKEGLSADQFIQILKANFHPEHRSP